MYHRKQVANKKERKKEREKERLKMNFLNKKPNEKERMKRSQTDEWHVFIEIKKIGIKWFNEKIKSGK